MGSWRCVLENRNEFAGAWLAAAAAEDMNCSVLSFDSFMFCVRTSSTSLNVMLVSASLFCKSMTTLLLCSSTCFSSAVLEPPWALRCLTSAWSVAICLLILAMSCLMTKVSSLISTGRSSKSVLRLANCANFPSLTVVLLMSFPIALAMRVNSLLPSARACLSRSRCLPGFFGGKDERLRMDSTQARNSFVRSCDGMLK